MPAIDYNPNFVPTKDDYAEAIEVLNDLEKRVTALEKAKEPKEPKKSSVTPQSTQNSTESKSD